MRERVGSVQIDRPYNYKSGYCCQMWPLACGADLWLCSIKIVFY